LRSDKMVNSTSVSSELHGKDSVRRLPVSEKNIRYPQIFATQGTCRIRCPERQAACGGLRGAAGLVGVRSDKAEAWSAFGIGEGSVSGGGTPPCRCWNPAPPGASSAAARRRRRTPGGWPAGRALPPSSPATAAAKEMSFHAALDVTGRLL